MPMEEEGTMLTNSRIAWLTTGDASEEAAGDGGFHGYEIPVRGSADRCPPNLWDDYLDLKGGPETGCKLDVNWT